jgi:hypothetical protein
VAISFTRYIDITSGVIAGQVVRDRELILRMFTTNNLLPTNSFAEFDSPTDVENYFGSASQEYAIAAAYFSFISKTNTQPQKMSFASWVEAATMPLIFGDPLATGTLAQFVATGSVNHLTLNMASASGTPISETMTNLVLGGAGSMAAVAAVIQAKIQAANGDAMWTGATVTWNSTTGTFDLVGGVVSTATSPVSITVATSPDLGALLGWESSKAIFSNGSAAQSLTNTMIASTAASNNFGSYSFVPALSEGQWLELATWNATQNNMFMQLTPVTTATASAVSEGLINLPGVGITLSSNITLDFAYLMPGMIMAATDYTRRNASQNYMYQVGNFTPTVTDDVDANTYDPLRVNYYGETQTAGQLIEFYQRGTLTGLSSSPTDMGIYVNEMWFKDAAGAALMTYFLAVNQVSTNNAGRAALINILQSVITLALFNGTISAGTKLTPTQIAVITSISGDPLAYNQVQSVGYWLDVQFTSAIGEDDLVEWTANYTLIYKKNDAIRSVTGTHDLV